MSKQIVKKLPKVHSCPKDTQEAKAKKTVPKMQENMEAEQRQSYLCKQANSISSLSNPLFFQKRQM